MKHSILDYIIHIAKDELEQNMCVRDLDEKLIECGIDSLCYMALAVYIEERYDIELTFIDDQSIDYTELTFSHFIDLILNEIKSNAIYGNHDL